MSRLSRADLNCWTFPVLLATLRQLGYSGGMHPPEYWTRREVIDTILVYQEEDHGVPAGCDTCRAGGMWCGHGDVVPSARLCVGSCGELTVVRALCGAPRHSMCPGIPTVPPPPSGRDGTEATTHRSRSRGGSRSRDHGANPAQQEATDAAIGLLSAGQPLSLLGALEGAFAPLRTYEGHRRSRPFWQPPMPDIVYGGVHVVTGYTWERPYIGRATVLDRSGAWIAAASSAEVAHGPLLHVGAMDEYGGDPGYYLVDAYEWHESHHIPSPLGHAKPGSQVWVPAPTAALLKDLARQGRWPDVSVADAYTGISCRLTEWTGHVNALRRIAITTYGRQSEQYAAVKRAFGHAMSLPLGRVTDGQREWKCLSRRIDWTHTIQSQASATLWRWADDSRRVCPDHPPVALRAVDELVVPTAAMPFLTSKSRPGGRKPLDIDDSGIRLGTFKRKSTEQWEGK